jgi:hypothetical protein
MAERLSSRGIADCLSLRRPQSMRTVALPLLYPLLMQMAIFIGNHTPSAQRMADSRRHFRTIIDGRISISSPRRISGVRILPPAP